MTSKFLIKKYNNDSNLDTDYIVLAAASINTSYVRKLFTL